MAFTPALSDFYSLSNTLPEHEKEFLAHLRHYLETDVKPVLTEHWEAATFPKEIAEVRAIVGDMPLLVPGIGAQGGDIEATVKAGRTAAGSGMMINSSRAILYAKAEAGEVFTAAAARVARETRDAVNQYRFS